MTHSPFGPESRTIGYMYMKARRPERQLLRIVFVIDTRFDHGEEGDDFFLTQSLVRQRKSRVLSRGPQAKRSR